jgi:glycosyltransferase involved in cell wall biosynthesis
VLKEPRTSRKTKVAILSVTLAQGGAERFASTLLQNIDLSLIKPTLVLFRKIIDYPLPTDIPVILLNKTNKWKTYSAARRLAKWIDQEKPDIILCNIVSTGLFMGIVRLFSNHQPNKWIVRVGSPPEYTDRFLIWILHRLFLQKVDLFIANSNALALNFIKIYPFAKGRVSVIENAICIETQASETNACNAQLPDQTIPVVLFVGRLNSVKCPDVFIAAFEILLQQTDAQLWICGAGPLRSKMETQIRNLGIQNRVHFLGFRNDVHQIMKIAKALVLTSKLEGANNAIIEAQSLGLPVVSTNCPVGPAEIIDNEKSGFLVEIGATRQIAEALHILITDTSLRKKYSEYALKNAHRKYSITPIMAKWHSLLTSPQRTQVTGHPETENSFSKKLS